MNRHELIDKCKSYLGAAEGCVNNHDHKHYAMQMNSLLDLLLEELAGEARYKLDKPKPEKGKS